MPDSPSSGPPSSGPPASEAAGKAARDLADWYLGDWRVQPSLNRLVRGEETVRVEPKLMDVLRLLAQHSGRVLSKDEIADAVWPETFITESVITRAIAGLRKALGDDARSPRFIETIAKRGYRLLMEPVAEPSERPEPSVVESSAAETGFAAETGSALETRSPGESPPPAPTGAASTAHRRPAVFDSPADAAPTGYSQPPGFHQPYVVGQWVRGERFYGRQREISEILSGPRNGVWLLGGRAVGKTSMLKQLEYLTSRDSSYFPLFWDLQGSVEPEEVHEDFHGALADAEGRLEELGIGLEEVEADDFLVSLGKLRRAVRRRGRKLLLLWDEVEELLHLHERWPALLRKLRRALLSQEGVRTVLASGPRLWQLAEQRDDTSPFLHGFAPPLYLGPLGEDPARALIFQRQLSRPLPDSAPEAPVLGEQVAERILQLSGGHPTLLQLLCRRTVELGDVDAAVRSVSADPTVAFFFSVDFDLLGPLEQQILTALAAREEPTALDALGLEAAPAEIQTSRLHLLRLGVLRLQGLAAGDDQRLEIRSPLHRRWLAK
ncbi:MAG: winged helix-turn-helix domain-containing protein [Acidobacteriota bacterium]|nr:winged helix-turn-helix domain-containing protein [Acidobacteriota bacterium]